MIVTIAGYPVSAQVYDSAQMEEPKQPKGGK
jgi:hypothetical protein